MHAVVALDGRTDDRSYRTLVTRLSKPVMSIGAFSVSPKIMQNCRKRKKEKKKEKHYAPHLKPVEGQRLPAR